MEEFAVACWSGDGIMLQSQPQLGGNMLHWILWDLFLNRDGWDCSISLKSHFLKHPVSAILPKKQPEDPLCPLEGAAANLVKYCLCVEGFQQDNVWLKHTG